MEIIAGAVVLAAAGLVKGVVGLGLPPLAMGLLTLLMPPVEAAATMVVPALVTNVWQALAGPHLRALLSRFRLMLALTGLATLLLAGAIEDHARTATAGLGLLLVLYAGHGLAGRAVRFGPAAERRLGPLSGTLTGIVTAFTGVASMPAVPFLQSLGLGRDALVQAMGLTFTVSAIALLLALGVSGGLATVPPLAIAAATAGALAGMALGARLRGRFDERSFRRLVLAALAALGTYFLLRHAPP